MSGTAETTVRSLLAKMAVEVDAILLNNACGERVGKQWTLKSLTSRLIFPSTTAIIVDMYAQQRLRQMRRTLLAQYTLSPKALKQYVTEFLLWSLVQAYAGGLPNVLPKLHHWLPMCYTKRFASHVMTSKRLAIIQQVHFNADGTKRAQASVQDTFFAHEKSEDGYYPPHIEQFFGRIETAYGSVLPAADDKNAWTEVVAFAFFLVQSARNPNPDGKRFHRDHRARLIPNIFAAVDAYDTPHIQFAWDCTNLWFSPFFPPRIRKTVSGVTAAVFPMMPHVAMVVTDSEINDFEAHRIATSNAATMVRHAARTGKPLYGMTDPMTPQD